MKSLKHARLAFALFGGLCSLLVVAFAQVAIAAEIRITINGQEVSVRPQAIVYQGRVLVPLRGVVEHMGVAVEYDRGQIHLRSGADTIDMAVNSNMVTINGQTQPIDVPPLMHNGSVYVPIRLVSEATGADITWDGSSQSIAIQIATPAPTPAPTPPPTAPPFTARFWP